MYFIIALAMEKQGFLQLTYADLVPLWSVGALMVGLAAVPAGWFSDRWSSTGMMVVFFLGLGSAGIACAFAEGTTLLWLGLTAVGLFSAIYHPVGIPWVVKNAKSRGKALGINGIFGVIGVAIAGGVAGTLSDLISWRAAFAVPGVLCLLSGLVLLVLWRRGLVSEGDGERMSHKGTTSRGDRTRAFIALAICMTAMGLIFQAMQTAMPKLFEIRLGGSLSQVFGDGATGPGIAVLIAYSAGGVMQLVGGHLADRYPLKPIYVLSFLLQLCVLLLVASTGSLVLVVFAAFSAALSTGALPAENMLLARYAPAKHRGLAFGVKYVLAFGTAPLAIGAASWVLKDTGEFTWLLYGMAGLAAIAVAFGILLPGERPAVDDTPAAPAGPAAQPAE